MDKFKKTIAIDFDGVIHKYSKGWQNGKLYDKPVEGSLEAMLELYAKGYKIVVFTTREDTTSVRGYIFKWYNELYPDQETFAFEVTNKKPPAIAYIDDRGIRFTNWKDILNYF